MSGNVGRPNGFPRKAWALLADNDQRREAKAGWWAASKRYEALGYSIVAGITGTDCPEAPERPSPAPSTTAPAAKAGPAQAGPGQKAVPVIVNCDGLCEPRNPGGTATFGWVARQGGELLGSDCGVVARGPKATSNLAEYTAVTEALRWLAGQGYLDEHVVLRSDSQLVIYQLDGTYAVRSTAIWPLWAKAHALAKKFRHLHLEWVRREANTEADALTREAYRASRTPAELAAAREARAGRARELAPRARPHGDGTWQVPSSKGHGWYTVALSPSPTCTCPDFVNRRAECKHILAVLSRAEEPEGVDRNG